MPEAHRVSCNLAFKLNMVSEAETLVDNPKITTDKEINSVYWQHVGINTSDWFVFFVIKCQIAEH